MSRGQSGERRRQAVHPAKTVPELVADGPSQVFTWDITKAAGPRKGIWYHAYVIIDIFSRYIVGHTVEAAESAERAEELIRETIARNGRRSSPRTQGWRSPSSDPHSYCTTKRPHPDHTASRARSPAFSGTDFLRMQMQWLQSGWSEGYGYCNSRQSGLGILTSRHAPISFNDIQLKQDARAFRHPRPTHH
ncbi:DDE-type integrase/transposase/recombinase [Kitasatospora sp. NPDC091335]|uniref:DDE-type integrase/transposase/recombinase n=1 Tax=Kitasatospora sp. NPDC091335 TaxID=3364085 RepID=UPI0038263F7C